MEKEDLIKQCRFYKGENECPFTEGVASFLWECEKEWVEDPVFGESLIVYFESAEKEWANKQFMKESYCISSTLDELDIDDFYIFERADGIPTSLKALIFYSYYKDIGDYCKPWAIETFVEFYLFYYLGLGAKPVLHTSDKDETNWRNGTLPKTWEEWVARERK